MNIAKERRAIDEALNSYREEIDTLPDDLFDTTPHMGGWSYAEVYDHIMKASLGSSIALERCTNNNCPPTKKGLTLAGYYILFMNSFPPGGVKMPESVAGKMTPTKIDKEEAKNLIIKTRKRIDGIVGLVQGASLKTRWQHPRMGMLNAQQWLKFIRIHLQHHLKQLDRIKNNFSKK
jgi:hypothetical protein